MGVVTAACPHCGSVLEPAPRSSRKCPDCRQPIVVRTRKGDKLLFTPSGAEQYDREREREIATNKARRHATNVGLGELWDAHERELTQRFGRPPSGGDVFWGLANQALHDAMQTSDWARLSQLYFTMALHLRDEGRNFLETRREALRCSVREHMAQAAPFGRGEPLLSVLGCRPDCQTCAAHDGLTFRANDLLADDAPLPHDCEWCACGVRFDPDWLAHHAGASVPSAADAPAEPTGRTPADTEPRRRGLFRRLLGS